MDASGLRQWAAASAARTCVGRQGPAAAADLQPPPAILPRHSAFFIF